MLGTGRFAQLQFAGALISLLALFAPQIALAAIALDTQQFNTSNASANTYTFSGIVVNAANEELLIECQNNGTTNSTVTSPAFNGTSMTTVEHVAAWLTGLGDTYIFALNNPSTGTHSFTAVTTGATNNVICIALTYSGVSSQSPIDVHGNTGLSTSATLNLSLTGTNSTSNDIMTSFVFDNDGATNPIASSTHVANTYTGYANIVNVAGDSIGTTTPTAGVAYTQTWKVTAGNHSLVLGAMLETSTSSAPVATPLVNASVPIFFGYW